MATTKQNRHLDMSQNELQNFVVQNLGTAPAAPKAGQPYFNTATNHFVGYNGTNWVELDSQGASYTFSTGLTNTNGTITLNAATTGALGGVIVGTNISVNNGTISVADASTSTKGVIEIATDTEASTGTATTLAVNPKQLATKVTKLSTGPTAGTYTKVTINGEGQVTSGGSLASSDVTTALGFTPYNATNPNGYQANVIESIKVNNVAQTITSKAVNIIVPTTAADVSALPDSTKYGATIDVSLNTTDYKLTMSLKDQDGTVLNSKVVDFPIESVVVNGSYDSTNKKIVLTLQNGNTIEFSVADLVSGLQTEITSSNKLGADLVDDSASSHKFVTATDKTTWNGKQDAINDLATIRSGAAAGATATQKITADNPALTASGGQVTWTITNSLSTKYVAVHVYETSTGDEVGAEIIATASTITIKMNSASNVAANTYFAVVIG